MRKDYITLNYKGKLMRKGFELGFQEIALAIIVMIFLVLLVLIALSVVEPGTSAVEVFGKRGEGLLG